jgi:hypothetical protein
VRENQQRHPAKQAKPAHVARGSRHFHSLPCLCCARARAMHAARGCRRQTHVAALSSHASRIACSIAFCAVGICAAIVALVLAVPPDIALHSMSALSSVHACCTMVVSQLPALKPAASRWAAAAAGSA